MDADKIIIPQIPINQPDAILPRVSVCTGASCTPGCNGKCNNQKCNDQKCNDEGCTAGHCTGTGCTVEAIMTHQVVTVTMDQTVAQVRELFCRHGFHHLLVTDNGHAAGLISDRDLLKNLSPFVGTRAERTQDSFCLHRKAHQIMTRKLIWVPPETPIQDAIALLLAHGLTCLPVLDEYLHIMGIVTWRDLLRAALREGVEPGPTHLPPTREIQGPRAEQRLIPMAGPMPPAANDHGNGEGNSLKIVT